MSDEYQVRYLEHMARKSEGLSINDDVERLKKVKDGLTHLVYLMESRRSQRKFNKEPLSENEVDLLLQAAVLAPSSCNRQAIYFVKGNEFLLNEILVGGKNWIRNADQVWLVMGAKEAYKNPAEQGFMPYLDAGFVCENVYLMAEALDIGCCFVNPHIRDDDKSVSVF